MKQFLFFLVAIALSLTAWAQAEIESLEVKVFTNYVVSEDLSNTEYRRVNGDLEILNSGKETLSKVKVSILMRDGYGKSLNQYAYEEVKEVWEPGQSLKTTWSWYNPTTIDVFLPLLTVSGTDPEGKPFEFTVNRQVGETRRSIGY